LDDSLKKGRTIGKKDRPASRRADADRKIGKGKGLYSNY
jgi:hypothetical protein